MLSPNNALANVVHEKAKWKPSTEGIEKASC